MNNIQVILEVLVASGYNVKEQSAFYKVTGNDKGKALYIKKTKSLREVHASGFTPDMDNIQILSEQDAKELRLGKVRGILKTPTLPEGVDGSQVLESLCEYLNNGIEGNKRQPKVKTEEQSEEQAA